MSFRPKTTLIRRKSDGDFPKGTKKKAIARVQALEEGGRVSEKKLFKFRQWLNRKRKRPPLSPPTPPPQPTGDVRARSPSSVPSSSRRGEVSIPPTSSIPHQEAAETLENARKLLGPGFHPENHMRLERFTTRRAAIGPFYESGYTLRLHDLPADEDDVVKLWALVQAVLGHACLRMLDETQPRHRGQLVASHDNLYSSKSTKWTQLSQLSMKGLIGQLEAARQSDSGVDFDGLVFTLRYADPNEHTDNYGSRLKRTSLGKRVGGVEDFAKISKFTIDPASVLKLKESDENCLPAACVIGAYLAEENAGSGRLFKKIFKQRIFLRARLKELIQKAFGAVRRGPYQIEQTQIFAQTLAPHYRILCFTQQGPPLFTYGPENGKPIHLFFYESHVWVITRINKFITAKSKTRKWMCENCYGVASKKLKSRHKCPSASCRVCEHPGCPNIAGEVQIYGIPCPRCRVMFFTEACKTSHEARGECTPSETRCMRCGTKNPTDSHEDTCGTFFCRTCHGSFPPGHNCFMAKLTPRRGEPEGSNRKPIRHRFYLDFETQTRKRGGEHRPNLLIAQRAQLIGEGKDGSEDPEPEDPVTQPIVFKGLDCVKQFVQILLMEDEAVNPFRDSYCIFHNLSGYDGHFLFAEFTRQRVDCAPVFREQRLLTMTLQYQNVEFRDSLLFIPNTPLSQLPKMWGLKEGMMKGMFPHALNTAAMVYAEGATGIFRDGSRRWPHKKYWEPWKMKPEARRIFTAWWQSEQKRYKEDRTLKYDIMKELEIYCAQDVRILRLSFESFLRACWRKNPGVPVLESLTLPAYCNAVFRTLHLVGVDDIALLPGQGFRQKCSFKALGWLAWKKRELSLTFMRTARHGPEFIIFGRGVDGYGESSDGTRWVFQYMGCRWHCHDPELCLQRENVVLSDWEKIRETEKRMADADYLATLARLGGEENGVYGKFRLVVGWECQVDEEKKHNKEMQEFIKEYLHRKNFHKTPLSPRETMAGGRTLPIMHHLDSARDPSEAASYLDFTSLYPAVNACSEPGEAYPLGMPSVYISTEINERWRDVEEALKSGQIFGLARCTLRPPKICPYPSIFMHQDGKLFFPLCSRCTREYNQGDCTHKDVERDISGVFTTYEIQFALDKQGYGLVRCQEVWHFERRSSTLLRSFIYSCYLDKEYASGPPPWATTQDLLEKHAADVSALLGVPVDPKKFVKNPSMRSLAKVMMNSFWGFFGKKSDNLNHTICQSFDEFRKLDSSRDKEIVDATVVGEIILASWRHTKPKVDPKGSTLIATYTTAMARVRLNKAMMEHVGRVAYVDTDSLLIVGKAPETATGSFGVLKDEIEADHPGKGAFVSSYAALGSKSTIMTIHDGVGNHLETRKRMKGIVISSQVDRLVTKDRFVSIIKQAQQTRHAENSGENGSLAEALRVKQTIFKKDYRQQLVKTMDILKIIRFTSDKQRILRDSPTLDSVPYGTVSSEPFVE